MICLLRHILAIVHFNSNLHREEKKKEDGVERVKVSYPKFKNGEATVQMQELFRTLVSSISIS